MPLVGEDHWQAGMEKKEKKENKKEFLFLNKKDVGRSKCPFSSMQKQYSIIDSKTRYIFLKLSKIHFAPITT